ncbi:MAG TPA: hypothetical protein VHU92_23640 [Streptosporangiaceae bacterium]|nr:hypothetical protein [Streptosporangiaceae bacterium]
MTSRTARPAPVLCHYAGDPGRRPHCTLTAQIAVGSLALCRSCAAARSTLGKGTAPAALPPGPAIDVLDWVADASLAADQASGHLTAAITRARSRGRSWAQIAARIGVTRQAAQQRYGRPPSPRNEG